MARIRQKHTAPEIAVRRAAHAAGMRFRLHRRDLPGSPDLVFPRRRLVVFVHGCFWHRHAHCKRTTTPRSNTAFWQAKFAANQARDVANIVALEKAGWRAEIVWECETKAAADLQ